MAVSSLTTGDLRSGWGLRALQSVGDLCLMILTPVIVLGYQAVISLLKSESPRP